MLARNGKNKVWDVRLLGKIVPFLPSESYLIQNVENFLWIEAHFPFGPIQNFVFQCDQIGFVEDLLLE